MEAPLSTSDEIDEGPSTSAPASSSRRSAPPAIGTDPSDSNRMADGSAGVQTSSHQSSYRYNKEQVQIHRRAKAARAHGQPEAALSILYNGLAQYPEDRHFISLAASIESKLGNHAKAEQLLQAGLQRHPKHLAFLTAAGTMHARAGDFEQARRCFEKARQANPEAATVLQVGFGDTCM